MMMSGKINSRQKGAAGERELAHELERVLGCTARRGVQFSGSPASPDIVTNLPGIHIECKRTEHFNLYAALDQATRDSGKDETPVVCYRSNLKDWVVIVRLDDLPLMLNKLLEDEENGD